MTILRTEQHRDSYLAFLVSQPLPLEVSAKPHKPTRSSEQNRLLWALYEPIADFMGYDREDVHEWMCGRMWGWKDVKVPKTPRNPEGLASVPVRSTTRNEEGKRSVIDSTTFTKFIDMVERIAAQAGVYVQREAA